VGELQRNLDRLLRRWVVLALTVVLGGAAGVLWAKVTPPTYTASAVLVATTIEATGDNRQNSFAQAFARLVGQPDISTAAADNVRLPAEQVRTAVQATTSPDTPLIELTGAADTPAKAAGVVNAVATAVVNVADSRQAETGVTLLMLTPAGPPTSPSSPKLAVDVAVGCAAGFLLGGLFVVATGARSPASPRPPIPAPPRPTGPPNGGFPRRAVNGPVPPRGAPGKPPRPPAPKLEAATGNGNAPSVPHNASANGKPTEAPRPTRTSLQVADNDAADVEDCAQDTTDRNDSN
jgi:capsular polysaccharide biosynthesis protein